MSETRRRGRRTPGTPRRAVRSSPPESRSRRQTSAEVGNGTGSVAGGAGRFLPHLPTGAWWSILALLLCMGLLGTAAGGTFRVRSIRVVGANLPTTAIIQTAGVRGDNIFAVRSDDIVRRLAAVRQIVVLRVATTFPDRVTIYARMRQAIVAWRDGAALYELDPDGRIVRQVTTTALPIIAGRGGPGPLGPGVVEAVRYAVQTLPTAPNGSIAALELGPHTGLTIVGRAGWTADVGRGTPQTLVDRIATLVALLDKLQGQPRRLQSVDLRYPAPDAHLTGS